MSEELPRECLPARDNFWGRRGVHAAAKAEFVTAKTAWMNAVAKIAIGLGFLEAPGPVASANDVFVAHFVYLIARRPFGDVAEHVEYALVALAPRHRTRWHGVVEAGGFTKAPQLWERTEQCPLG